MCDLLNNEVFFLSLMVLFRFVMAILKASEFFTNKMNLRTCESRNLIPFFSYLLFETQQIIVSPKIVKLSTNKVIKMTVRFLVSKL